MIGSSIGSHYEDVEQRFVSLTNHVRVDQNGRAEVERTSQTMTFRILLNIFTGLGASTKPS